MPVNPSPLPAFTTASLPRTDSLSAQIATPAPSPALAFSPDRTALLPEPGQTLLEPAGEHLSAAESQFDRPRQPAVRRKTWVKRSSRAWAKRDGAINANLAFFSRKTKPTGDETARQLGILKRYLERQKGDARDFSPHKATDARRHLHKKQALDSALRSIGRALGF